MTQKRNVPQTTAIEEAQSMMDGLRNNPDEAVGMDHDNLTWKVQWQLVLTGAPDLAGEFIQITSKKAHRQASVVLDTLIKPRGLLGILNSPSAVAALLDVVRAEETPKDYAIAVNTVVSCALHDLLLVQSMDGNIEVLEILVDRHNLATRRDLGAGSSHLCHMLVNDAFAAAGQVLDKKPAPELIERYMELTRDLFGQLLGRIVDGGGSLEHPTNIHTPLGERIPVSGPLEQACLKHGNQGGGDAIIAALLDHGACWDRVLETLPEGHEARHMVEHHPGVMRERLEAIVDHDEIFEKKPGPHL